MKWYFPSWMGDFRLVPIEDSSYRSIASGKKCVLEIVDPTDAERVRLTAFLEAAKEKGWTELGAVNTVDVDGRQKQEVLLDTTVTDAGLILVGKVQPLDRTITAVRSENGKVSVHGTAELELAGLATIEKEQPKAKAASVKRATPSCPQCVPGSVKRASEVLLSFLNEEEHASWAAERHIIVTGGITGHRYVLAHRHSVYAQKIGRICYDLDDGQVIHFHDNSVPPEEEVLGAKLILEHREPWLRNEATTFAGDTLFKNPFGDGMDGVWDAGVTQQIGTLAQNLEAMTRKS